MQQIQTKKFSDVSVLVRTLLPLNRDTITKYNVLIFMLKAKTKAFDTKQKLSIALNHAYGMRVSYGLTGYGKQIALDARFQYLRPDLIDAPHYVDEVVKVMDEILYHPLLDEQSFEEAKYLLSRRLMRQDEDPDTLALKLALSLVDEDHDISIPIQGYLKDLESMQFEEIISLYEQWKHVPRIVYCCGMLDPKIDQFLSSIPQTSILPLEHSLIPQSDPSFEFLQKRISQTSIVQVYATNTSIDSENYYSLLVLNSILGQGPMSLLFEHVREQHSLCYSISSSLIRFDGALLISTGTSANHLDECLRLIDEQIQTCVQGNFSDEEMEIAKMDLIDMFRRQQDRPWSMIEQDFLDTLLKRKDSLQERIQFIKAIDRQSICAVASQLHLVSMAVIKEEERC